MEDVENPKFEIFNFSIGMSTIGFDVEIMGMMRRLKMRRVGKEENKGMSNKEEKVFRRQTCTKFDRELKRFECFVTYEKNQKEEAGKEGGISLYRL